MIKYFINKIIWMVIIMSFFSSIFNCKGNKNKFVSEKKFESNLSKQMNWTPQTIKQLSKYGITDKSELKLEYFFYTNSEQKALNLSKELINLGYTSIVDFSVTNKKKYLINGWTIKLKMDEKNILNWTKEMCELGYKYDCDFDGWGTSPDQN